MSDRVFIDHDAGRTEVIEYDRIRRSNNPHAVMLYPLFTPPPTIHPRSLGATLRAFNAFQRRRPR